MPIWRTGDRTGIGGTAEVADADADSEMLRPILDFGFWIEVSGRRPLIDNLKSKIPNRMVPLYQQQLAALRQAFPTPVSDPVHDGYVVFSLLRALDRVHALKTQAPILGTPREPDYARA